MSTAVTVPELLDRVRKSALISPEDLNNFLADSVVAPLDEDGPALLNRLVDACLLTKFQADRIASGKYKGFVLGGYLILDQIGAGGMGQVFLAEHTTMRRMVAIKVLHLPVVDDPIARERFIREARAAAALNHANMVRVFDLNREGKLLYLVMEFIEGLTLQQWISQRGRLRVGAAINFTVQIAQALQHAHECGLVHRDVKPGNILIDRAGVARLLDLGLARNEADTDSKLTGTLGTSILGTADYLAPEQAIDSHNVDIRADIYSLGATLYYQLAGQVLFPEGRTAQKLMYQQWKEPTPIRELNAEVPEPLAAILAKSLAKKRDERFQTPAEFAEALFPFLGDADTPPSELITKPPKRRWPTRALDPNASLSSFKLEFSPVQSALYQLGTGPGVMDSRTRLIGPASVNGSSDTLETKPNSINQLTPLTLPNPARPMQPEEPAPIIRRPAANLATEATPKGSHSLALIFAGLGVVIGLLLATVAYLLFAGR